jgi:plasmid stabilization system protein ParE
MKNFRVSDLAADDLKRIVEYTKTHWGENQAKIVRDKLKEMLLVLQAFPRLLTKTDKTDYFVKTVPKLPFIIVCIEEKEEFVVMQILHDKQKRLF